MDVKPYAKDVMEVEELDEVINILQNMLFDYDNETYAKLESAIYKHSTDIVEEILSHIGETL